MAKEHSAKRQIKASFLASEMQSLGSVHKGMTITAASVVQDNTQNTILAAFEDSPQMSSISAMVDMRCTEDGGIEISFNGSAIEDLCQEAGDHCQHQEDGCRQNPFLELRSIISDILNWLYCEKMRL